MPSRILSAFLVALTCALPRAALAPAGVGVAAPGVAQASLVVPEAPHAEPLTDADREAFRIAQRGSDPALGEQRGGILGLILLIVLILAIAGHHGHHHGHVHVVH
jgi:hypothetical protein